MSTIAFLGVGSMGLPMAAHLITAGHRVRAFDPSSAQVARATEAGAHPADTAAEAVSGADIVVIMVATGDQLLSLFTGSDGITNSLNASSICVIMSTVGVEAVRDVERLVRPRQVALLDAPVTGGAAGAEAATLTILVGGAAEVVDRCRSALDAMGRLVICGPNVGDGQSVKLVNQLLCSTHLAAAGEALAFAKSLGLDPARVLDTVSSGAAHSWMLADRGPRMLQDNPDVRSSIDIFVKDSTLVQTAARRSGLRVPLLDAAAERFRTAAAAGLGRRDDSAVISTYHAETGATPAIGGEPTGAADPVRTI
jgi:3-hydroxyisobutyrate dehydrogenase-like beta-hydroxyacid dehydrogenase